VATQDLAKFMSKPKKSTIEVQGTTISVLTTKGEDFISLTDMLKAKDGDFFIGDWLRSRNTVEFLGIWESVHNAGFNYGEFATIKRGRHGIDRNQRVLVASTTITKGAE
jgi:hypothetical protein